MRTIYLGTSAFAAAVLERLAHSDHRPGLVVTRPERPRGRGRRLGSPPVAREARRLGLELAQPDSVNSSEGQGVIAAARPEVVVICAFGALIKEPLLSEHEMLNVHPSLLPRWRGAAPMERAIDAGDTLTGVSIMRPTAELDAGPVCLAREEPILLDDDFASLSARLAALGGELLVEALDHRPPCVAQGDDGVTFAPKIEAADRRLDARAATAHELERRVRALRPHVGAWVELPGEASEGDRLGVHSARAIEDAPADSSGTGPALVPGELVAYGDRLLLGCAPGLLELLEVQPSGGRRMPAADWLRGHGRELARGHAPAEGVPPPGTR
jgi:methionyl-tRNA formyltransferase